MSAKKPDKADRDGDERQETEHALELEADQMVAARAICLSTEGIERGC